MKKIIGLFKNLSMQEQIILSLSSLIILGFVIMNIVSYSYTRYTLTNTVTNNAINSLKQLSQMLEEKFYTIHLFANLMSENDSIKNMLRTSASQKTPEEILEENTLLKTLYDDFKYYNSDMSGMMVLSFSGDIYRFGKTYEVDTKSYQSTDWFQNAMKKNGIIAWNGKRKSPYAEYGEDIYLLYLSRELIDSRDRKPLGIFYLEIKEKEIHNMLVNARYDESESLYIISPSGELVSHTDHNMLSGPLPDCISQNLGNINGTSGSFIDTQNGQKVLNVYFTSPITGWHIVYSVPFNSLITRMGIINTINLWVSFIGLVVIILVSFLVLRRIITPLKTFSKNIISINNGNGQATLRTGKSEVAYLSNVFEDMTGQIRQLLLQVRTEEQQKNTAQIRALQAQINPHFIYNTLETISMVCEIHDNTDAAKMLNILGRLLRYGLNQADEGATLGEEIEQISLYIRLMKYRYKDSFEVEYKIDEEAKGAFLPKTMLQPIVENSIFHGFGSSAQDGLLKISAKRQENLVEITIADNGCGFDSEKSATEHASSIPQLHGGIGLNNIHNRIGLVYGKEYGLTVTSQKGKGTNVKILIPYLSGGEHL